MTGNIAEALRNYSRQAYTCTGGLIDALHPEEPVYLFCGDKLTERAQRFITGFNGAVSYAVKANPEPRILQTLIQSGIRHFDVASLGEIRTVLTLCPTANLHYNNPVKASEAILEAYQRHNVKSFALDEMSELEKIREATGGDRDVCYTVRFKLAHNGAAYDFGSKFGATIEKAAQLLQAPWPGNVRQLINVAERSVLQSRRGSGTIASLLMSDHEDMQPVMTTEGKPLKEYVEAFERMLIDNTMRRHKGSIAAVMDELCLPRRTLNEKMAKYGLQRSDYL